MADQGNFLLGYGERLTEPIAAPSRGAPLNLPYSIAEARAHLAPLIVTAASELDALPDAACPNDQGVALLTLHPQALSKTAFPSRLLREVGLETIGSRPSRVTPRAWSRVGEPRESESTTLFVAGARPDFRSWGREINHWTEATPGVNDLAKLESLSACRAADRLREIPAEIDEPLLEVAIHANPDNSDVLDSFEAYAAPLGMRPDFDRRLHVGGLCFFPLKGPRSRVDDLAKFTYLRVARLMPSLRPIAPLLRSVARSTPRTCQLPDEDPVDPALRAAVFDGGVAPGGSLARWVKEHDAGAIGLAVSEYLRHGSNVSSALLFGSLDSTAAARPFGFVDHFRVLDEQSGRDTDLFDVLIRIRDVIQSTSHQFLNLSIGPEIPIEDDEVHAWTSVLDDLLSDGDRLATIAVGNGGQRDAALRYNRVQVPSDCVNAMAIGAASSRGAQWKRAIYSSVGPGRGPGLVKPDAVAFGGDTTDPFFFVDAANPQQVDMDIGTSFAAPSALRLAMGIRAHFGDRLTPLAIKALLVHAAEDGVVKRHEGGWGRLPADLDDFVLCPDGTARIVYQGELSPGRYLRAPIPMPAEQLEGDVSMKATLCYATPIDAAHPGSYTRAGIDIVFFPHDERFDEKSDNLTKVKSAAFFQLKEFSSEQELRSQAHKWETTLHRERMTKRGSSLSNPVFTIHYNAREGGASTRAADKVRYALVVSVNSKRTTDLYDRIVRRYATQIEPLAPVVQIPVRAQVSS